MVKTYLVKKALLLYSLAIASLATEVRGRKMVPNQSNKGRNMRSNPTVSQWARTISRVCEGNGLMWSHWRCMTSPGPAFQECSCPNGGIIQSAISRWSDCISHDKGSRHPGTLSTKGRNMCSNPTVSQWARTISRVYASIFLGMWHPYNLTRGN